MATFPQLIRHLDSLLKLTEQKTQAYLDGQYGDDIAESLQFRDYYGYLGEVHAYLRSNAPLYDESDLLGMELRKLLAVKPGESLKRQLIDWEDILERIIGPHEYHPRGRRRYNEKLFEELDHIRKVTQNALYYLRIRE